MKRTHRFELLGAGIDRLSTSDIMNFIARRVAQKTRAIVANHNLHSLYLYQKDTSMRAFYDRVDLIEIDSMPLIAWGRMMGHDLTRQNRCTYLDFRDEFWALAAERGWKVYHVGGKPEHNEASKAEILRRHPGISLEMHHGYFDVNGAENQAVINDIHDKAPDVLLVGMGMPRQELWILRNLERLPDCVMLPIGAAFDYEAGVQTAAPRWTGQIGLEWLVRFACDPKRLFGRYFLEPWTLMPLMMVDVWRHKVVAEEARPALTRR
jgi:N-acetylglucosaminyldiphosphoundecaprenol N-acetyl-beta-D-mannosaminyltransferase